MNKAGKRLFLMMVAACVSILARAQGAPPVAAAKEREYPFPLVAVETALKQLGAYSGARLPTLDGFVQLDRIRLPQYERPYYEYKIETEAKNADHSVVHVRANVSAWFADPAGNQSGYQAFPSNGRLELDLLDRLGEFLAKNSATLVTDPAILERQLNEVRQQRLGAERRVAELQKNTQPPAIEKPGAEKAPQFVVVTHSHVPVRVAREDNAQMLLQAQAEDEFEVIERQAGWLQVKLEDGRPGWVRSSQAQPADTGGAPMQASDDIGGFIAVRESISIFDGEWAGLKGKQALYLWVKPTGSALGAPAATRLRFAEALFDEHGRIASHSRQTAVDGIVVVFLDQGGGVAAASLRDIRLWLDGDLTRETFLKHCSLDPPSEFTQRRSAQPPRH